MEQYKTLVLTSFKNHNNTKTKYQKINDKSSKNYILKQLKGKVLEISCFKISDKT